MKKRDFFSGWWRGLWRKDKSVETIVAVLIEIEKGGGDPGYITRKDAVTTSGSQSLTRRPIPATSPAYVTPYGRPCQIWKDATTK